MKNTLIVLAFAAMIAAACNSPKNFASVQEGMTKEEVIKTVGEPEKKNDIGVAELWVYPAYDRTIVFRNGDVYSIITSGEARIDSVKMSMDNLKDDVDSGLDKLDRGLEKTGAQIDSVANRVKKSLDTLRNKKN